jgi:hypothetical protein
MLRHAEDKRHHDHQQTPRNRALQPEPAPQSPSLRQMFWEKA